MGIDIGQIADGVWRVFVIGVVFGAGLPGLFALGMRSLSAGRVTPDGTLIEGGQTSAVGRFGAVVCFGLCLLAALFGVVVIMFGKQIFGS